TEGLLLLTNHGALAHRVLSPKVGIAKRYLAEVDGPLDAEDARAFAQGLPLAGFTALPATLTVLESGPHGARALCEVREGKYHQVRRMFAARGRTVTYLKRLSIGPLALGGALEPGAHRKLTSEEIGALYAQVGLPKPDGH
ncbi:MAG: pseudouridine synthase, partial [Clostridia bacterium]|nr:pseudouridine synthase [Clostridia bacterium]